jgi:hypothetical protein
MTRSTTYQLSYYYKLLLLLLLGILSFIGINLSGLSITSVSFQETSQKSGEIKQAVRIEAPYLHPTSANVIHKATVTFDYRGYGNTELRLTPAKCLAPNYIINGQKGRFQTTDKDALCTEVTANLKEHIKSGANILEVELSPFATPRFKNNPFLVLLAVGAPLFGSDLLQSICASFFVFSLSAMLWLFLKQSGHDLTSRVIFIFGFLLAIQRMHVVFQFADSTDLDGHVSYIQAMSNHFFSPYAYTDNQYWHPPLYYWLCAIIAKILAFFGVIDPWTGIRFLAVMLRVVLLYFGMRCFQLFLKGHYFYLALAMLAVWPSSLYQSTYISNDILYIAFYAGCFYYTCIWHQTLASKHLMKALIFCGLGFAAKTAGVVPALILTATAVSNLFYGRCTFHSLLNKNVILGCSILAAGVLFNMGRWMHAMVWLDQGLPDHYLGVTGRANVELGKILSFSFQELIENPFGLRQRYEYYINFFLTNILLTALTWKSTAIAGMLHVLHLALLAYIALGISAISPRHMKSMTPVFYGVILPFIAVIAFLYAKRNIWCLDFRYIQPALIPMIIMMMVGVKALKSWGRPKLHIAAVVTVIAFIQLSLALFQIEMMN